MFQYYSMNQRGQRVINSTSITLGINFYLTLHIVFVITTPGIEGVAMQPIRCDVTRVSGDVVSDHPPPEAPTEAVHEVNPICKEEPLLKQTHNLLVLKDIDEMLGIAQHTWVDGHHSSSEYKSGGCRAASCEEHAEILSREADVFGEQELKYVQHPGDIGNGTPSTLTLHCVHVVFTYVLPTNRCHRNDS